MCSFPRQYSGSICSASVAPAAPDRPIDATLSDIKPVVGDVNRAVNALVRLRAPLRVSRNCSATACTGASAAIAALETTGWDDVLKEAQAAGKVVVIEDRRIDASDTLFATYIGSDFAEEGRKSAEEMCKLLESSEKKNVVELVGNKLQVSQNTINAISVAASLAVGIGIGSLYGWMRDWMGFERAAMMALKASTTCGSKPLPEAASTIPSDTSGFGWPAFG